MSRIALAPDASGTGTLTIAAPDTNTNRTLNLPDSSGTLDTLQRAGNILQVVQGITTTAVTNTTDTYVDSALSASITPFSATSKILVLVTQHFFVNDASVNTNGGMRILRDSTVVFSPAVTTAIGIRASVSSGNVQWRGYVPMCYLDSPATTSAITYKTQISDGTTTGVEAQRDSNPSTITLLEIAA